jgi:hypothetical protein
MCEDIATPTVVSNALTVTLGHVRLDDVMPDQFKIGMTDPMADGCLGTGEEIIEDGDFVSEEHETVDEVRSDEASSACDEDALSFVGGEQFNRRETGKGRV